MFHRLSHLRYAVSLKVIPGYMPVILSVLTKYAVQMIRSMCFIASVEELLRNLDFFLPRRNRVVAISRETGHSASGFATIGKDTDLTEILTVFDRILNKNNGNDENGELTARETEVLKELVSGLTVKEIADRLCISPSTVITHRKNISSKLGIRSISGLSLYALMNGII